MNNFKKIKNNRIISKIILFISIMGPGIITANVDNDAGGITTYSIAGASFGYSLIWTLLPITIALIIIQEMSNRMGVITGKGLSSLIREKFGVKFTFYLMIMILITNFGNVIAEFAGIAASIEIFGLNKFIFIPIIALLVWYLIVKGTYKSIEKIFLIACFFYIAYIITGFIVKPEWYQIKEELITPVFNFRKDAIIMIIGIVGTTIAPWMQFYQQSSVAEKKIKIQDYKYSKLDTIVGCIVVNVIAFFIIIVCGKVLFQNNIHIETAADAAKALKPLAGNYSSYLFAFGLLNASLFAASILPLSTSYSICESFGWETGLDKKLGEAPQFYVLYTLLIVLGSGFVLLPNLSLIKIMLISQVINGIVLPFVLISMLIIINDKGYMGNYKNSFLENIITVIFIIGISMLSVILGVISFIV